MSVQQLSVFVENKAGRLAEVLGLLGDRGVRVIGFAVADTSDYGIARLVVDRSVEAGRWLRDEGFTAIENPVICVGLEEGPESLPALVRLVSEAGVNIEYMYLAANQSAVLKVDDVERIEELLRTQGHCVVDQGDLLFG